MSRKLRHIFEVFGGFSDKLSALFWHCESLVHGKMYLVIFPTKTLGFRSKYGIGRKEFRKESSHFCRQTLKLRIFHSL